MSTKDRSYYVVNDTTSPPLTALVSGRAVVTPLYAIIPESVINDGIKSNLPFWKDTDCWVLTAPAIGFATKFVWYLMFVHSNGGCEEPEMEEGVESFIFLLEGNITLITKDNIYELTKGGFAYLPPDFDWRVHNKTKDTGKFIWIRKRYEPIREYDPWFIIGNEKDLPIIESSATKDKWSSHLLPDDMAYDMAVNIISFKPGMAFQITETHVMEHGLYMLQGKGVYLLSREWYEVHAGDYIWMRAFCPQAYYAGGPTTTRYILYKNINRQIKLR